MHECAVSRIFVKILKFNWMQNILCVCSDFQHHSVSMIQILNGSENFSAVEIGDRKMLSNRVN